MDLFLELIDVRLWRLTLFPEILKCIDQSLSLLGKVVLVTSIHLFIRDNLIPTNREITNRLTDTLVKRDFPLFDFLIEVGELFVGHDFLHVVEDLFSSFSLVVVMVQCAPHISGWDRVRDGGLQPSQVTVCVGLCKFTHTQSIQRL